MRHNTESGFTLMEMLVVIAIIGLLASFLLVSLGSSRAKARDTRRISDINEIRKALELYYQACGVYPRANASGELEPDASNWSGEQEQPGSSCPNGTKLSSFISPSAFKDPQGNPYRYVTLNDKGIGAGASLCPQEYHLGASLEMENNVPNNDSDAYSGSGVCNSFAGGSSLSDFNGSDNSGCSGESGRKCYDIRTCVTPPQDVAYCK